MLILHRLCHLQFGTGHGAVSYFRNERLVLDKRGLYLGRPAYAQSLLASIKLNGGQINERPQLTAKIVRNYVEVGCDLV